LEPDNDNDPGWEIPFTPFGQPEECSPVRVFNLGIHTFTVETIDNDGYKSRVRVEITYPGSTPVEETTWGRLKALFENGAGPRQ